MRTFWSSMAKRATPYVPGEQPNDQDVLKLNTNENPYPPSPAVTSAITKELGKDLRLYPPPNADDLKEVIAATYDVAKENVFVGNGSDEVRSEEHTSELQSRFDIVCRLLLEKKNYIANWTQLRNERAT